MENKMKNEVRTNESAFVKVRDNAEVKKELIHTATIIASGICANPKSWELCKEDLATASVELAKEIIKKSVNPTEPIDIGGL